MGGGGRAFVNNVLGLAPEAGLVHRHPADGAGVIVALQAPRCHQVHLEHLVLLWTCQCAAGVAGAGEGTRAPCCSDIALAAPSV